MREGPERVPVVIEETYDGIARLIAGRIAGLIRERGASVRRTVLGLATGSTPIGIYRELIRLHREEGLSFGRVVTFNELVELLGLPHMADGSEEDSAASVGAGAA